MHYSPLRYPGGKNKLSACIARICLDNNINGHFVEPYSGGASVALFLLIEGFVENITINDKDRTIYAFWHSILKHTKKFCELVENAELSIAEWKRQREIQTRKKTVDLLSLGFSAFYLNRTNRSGIIRAGVIGGMEQNGNYLMDSRFHKTNLIQRVKLIANHKKNIRLYNKDALQLIDSIQKEVKNNNIFFYFDPPYYLKSSSLYMNHYDIENHRAVSNKIKAIENIRWIVSYDNVPEIQELYSDYRKKELAFSHTAYRMREGKEIMFFSQNMELPEIADWEPLRFKLKRWKNHTKIIYK